MPSCFLTGGTGFFGKSILSAVQRRLTEPLDLVILSRNPRLFLDKNPAFVNMQNVRFVSGDVRNFKFPKQKFDYILHGATTIALPEGEIADIVLNGTKRVLQFAEECDAKRLLFISSGAVYGKQPLEMTHIREDYDCNPITEYGMAKLKAEKICFDSCINTFVARCFAFTGPYLDFDLHFAIGNFIRDCLNGKDIIIKGDGTPLRSYLYADDLVVWLFRILFDAANEKIYNIGSNRAVSILELAQIVRKTLNSPCDIRVLTPTTSVSVAERYVPDISNIMKDLKVKITVDLEEAIAKSAFLYQKK